MGLNSADAQFRTEPHIDNVPAKVVYKSQPWYEAYMGALFESDQAQIGDSIRRAEVLILKRERQLFSRSSDPAEQRALINALHALRALRGCHRL